MNRIAWETQKALFWAMIGAIVGAALGCSTTPQPQDAMSSAMQRNMKLCDKFGGMKKVEFESDHADVWCRDAGKGFRVWYYK